VQGYGTSLIGGLSVLGIITKELPVGKVLDWADSSFGLTFELGELFGVYSLLERGLRSESRGN